MDVSGTPPPELPNPARAPLEQREHLGQQIQRVSHRSLLRRLWQHERRFVCGACGNTKGVSFVCMQWHRLHLACRTPFVTQQLGHYGCGTFTPRLAIAFFCK